MHTARTHCCSGSCRLTCAMQAQALSRHLQNHSHDLLFPISGNPTTPHVGASPAGQTRCAARPGRSLGAPWGCRAWFFVGAHESLAMPAVHAERQCVRLQATSLIVSMIQSTVCCEGHGQLDHCTIAWPEQQSRCPVCCHGRAHTAASPAGQIGHSARSRCPETRR